jgi:hypothetical protein
VRSLRTVDKLVVDASVTIKWLNPHEPLAAQANAIREDYEHGHVALLVPAFWAAAKIRGQLQEKLRCS